MPACSSTDGSSLRLRKHSSVRNRPTPSTGASAEERAESPSATLASSLTGVPSAVRPGPVQDASAARVSRSASTRRAASASSGRVSTVPAVPSTSSGVPAATVRAPAVPTTHGIPSWRAMIAVWLVGPPRSVTSATTTAGSRPAVSEGARSSATRTEGRSGVGTPGSGTPTRCATTRRSMSRRSVTRSAIRPPMPVKTVTNCSTPACTAASSSSPERRDLRTAPRRPLSRARPALAVRTSAAAPAAASALRWKPSATAATARSYAVSASSSSREAPSKAATASGETSVRTTRAGPKATPGTTGVPCRRAGSCASEAEPCGASVLVTMVTS